MESQLAAVIKIKLRSITKAAIITFVCYRGYNGYRVPFPGAERPGRGIYHPLLFSANVKEGAFKAHYKHDFTFYAIVDNATNIVLLLS
jgi:hypothetical protein